MTERSPFRYFKTSPDITSLPVMMDRCTPRGALERFDVFNPVDHTTTDFQEPGSVTDPSHRSRVLGLSFYRAASSVCFKQVSLIFDSFRAPHMVAGERRHLRKLYASQIVTGLVVGSA